MLLLSIVVTEDFDEATHEFVGADTVEVELEHSLVSLSKWESKWEKPFLNEDEKTKEELLDYIKMMFLGELPPEKVLSAISPDNIKEIEEYINAKMTATWFSEDETPSAFRAVVTAEIIYYWMIALAIPFECQHWHLNRLMTLIKVCNIKNQPRKNMSQSEAGAMQRALNQERRKASGSSG